MADITPWTSRPLYELAVEAKKALDDIEATPDSALAMILVNIGASEDVREAASEWIRRFTEQVLQIVKEREDSDGRT